MANLTQLRMLEDLNGVLLVDKPEGISFSTVVKTVKRNFNLVKVGHGGSLDTWASGLLVLLINDANAYVDRVMGADRSYLGALRLGVATSTGERYGNIIGAEDASATVASLQTKIDAVLPQFKGDVFQEEMRFCSVRRDNAAEYEVVDTGAHKPFLAHVSKWTLAPDANDLRAMSFTLLGSKGLLPRVLVNDFGAALGCGATLTALRRTTMGALDVKDAISFQKLLETPMHAFAAHVRPVSLILPNHG